MKKQPQWINSTAERLLKGIGSLRSILLPALLLSCAHLTNGEILEYTINYDEKSEAYTQEAYNTEGWDEVATVTLQEKESLKFNAARFIRQFRIIPEEWQYDSRQQPKLKLKFTHDYLKKDFEFVYSYIDEVVDNREIFVDGKKLNLGNDIYRLSNHLVKENFMTGPCTVKIYLNRLKINTYPGNYSNNAELESNRKVYTPRQSITVKFNKTKSVSTSSEAAVNKNILVLPKGSGVNELILESSEDLITWEKDVPGDKNTDAENRFYRLRAVKK